jgi:lipoprotein-anchoring transpeptidase ErfK/SrfK
MSKKVDTITVKKRLAKKAVKIEKPKEIFFDGPGFALLEGILFGLKLFFYLSLLFISLTFVFAYIYIAQYQGRVYDGVKILGQNIGGKSISEAATFVASKTAEVKFKISVDGEDFLIQPSAAGIKFEDNKIVEVAANEGRTGNVLENLYLAVGGLAYRTYPALGEAVYPRFKNNLSTLYAIDEKKLTDFTDSVTKKFEVESRDAGLVMRGTEVQVIPAVYGKKIVTGSLKEQIKGAVESGDSSRISLSVQEVKPSIMDTETADAVAKSKAILELPVRLTYKSDIFAPEKTVVGGWIYFKSVTIGNKPVLVPEVDNKRVSSYLYAISDRYTIPAVNTRVTLKNGSNPVTTQEGKDGSQIDVESASAYITAALNSGKGVDMALKTEVIKSKKMVNNVLVADWSKYIGVDLSEQKMCAYTSGGVVVNCWKVTTGQRGRSTPVGTFLIRRKAGAGGRPGSKGGGVCMPNPPSRYPLCGINYVSYFTSAGHAIHEAWWRRSYGGPDYVYNGSHGCVNVTYDLAKFIYYWAPLGTPVVIQY